MTKVYIATSGEYSDFRVEAVFANEADAEAYELGGSVEEYELHDGPKEVRTWYRLQWSTYLPDRPETSSHLSNPHISTDREPYDGNPRHCTHKFYDDWGHRESRRLVVQGWDLDRVKKVYGKQRAKWLSENIIDPQPEEAA